MAGREYFMAICAVFSTYRLYFALKEMFGNWTVISYKMNTCILNKIQVVRFSVIV